MLLNFGILIFGYTKLLVVGAELELAFSYCNPLIVLEDAVEFMDFRQI